MLLIWTKVSTSVRDGSMMYSRKPRRLVHPGLPGVHDGRYPGGQAEGVGLDAESRGAGVHVGV